MPQCENLVEAGRAVSAQRKEKQAMMGLAVFGSC